MKRIPLLLLVAVAILSLAACSSNDADARWQAALTASQAESTRCRDTYPLDRQHIIQRTKCLNNSAATLRALSPHPDIAEANAAYNLMIAEQFRDGKLTEAEFLAKETAHRSQGIAEGQRRDLAQRSVESQERPQAVVVYPMTNTMPVFRAPCAMGPRGPAC